MAREWFNPVFGKVLDELTHIILKSPSDPNSIEFTAIKKAEEIISKAYGEAVYQVLLAKPAELRNLPKSVVDEAVEAIFKSGNLKRTYYVIYLLYDLPNFSKELIRKGAEKIIFSSEPGSAWWTFCLLRNIPNLPPDLIEEGVKRNQKRVRKHRPELAKVLDSILPQWLVNKNPADAFYGELTFFRTRSGIPVFADQDWKLIERSSDGILIGCKVLRHLIEMEVKVVLLPDVSGRGQGWAVEVPPEINTVHEARAWMYQQDAEKWKGFDKEV